MSVAVSAYIGIGANLGESQACVERAMAWLDGLPQSRLTGQSSLFRTAPIDADGDDYINAVARIETSLPAPELLDYLLDIEQQFGRQRRYQNAPRTLDLDILLYGSQVIQTDKLTVPHPRLTQRAFALIPLLQIDPLIVIPGQGPAHSFALMVADQSIQKV